MEPLRERWGSLRKGNIVIHLKTLDGVQEAELRGGCFVSIAFDGPGWWQVWLLWELSRLPSNRIFEGKRT